MPHVKSRWEGNIKMDVDVTVWEGVDWINLNQNRVKWRDFAKTVITQRIP